MACDNEDCPYEWFHYPCVGITDPPKVIFYKCFGGPGTVAARKSHKLRSSGSPSEEDRAWGNS